MKKQFILAIAALLFSVGVFGQSTADLAVQLTATVQATPARITLRWKKNPDTCYYNIYRKAKTATTWGTMRVSLGTRDTTWTDTAVVADSAYEYVVAAGYRNGATNFTATGYIYAGIKAPPIHNRGGIILMVDSTFSDSCALGINRLMSDLRGDGWQVYRHDVPRTMRDTSVKRLLLTDYNANAGIKAVFLLGHVAVPYSGDINPDAHTDHKGAWPADAYYAYLTAPWTDASVTDTSAGYAANRNVPGDGKWDQSGWTGIAELQVGRVDFWNMPAFGRTEVQMMNSYLNRDHAWKMDSINVRRRAVIDDNFGVFVIPSGSTTYYEAFASSGWRSFPPIVGTDSVGAGDFINNLDTSSCLWAYGCGGGSFGSAGGIGSTSDFASRNLNGIFTMLFGSYFGDWNVQNNFLRAPLCAPTPALTCAWSGRPYWFFHHLGLGEHIGYSAWLSQINDGNLYGPFAFGYQWVHTGFMGDPSLRNNYIKPASNLRIALIPRRGATVSWTASPDATIAGYYVYRSDNGAYGTYKLISGLLTGTTFNDTVGRTGLKYYMVRPTKLQVTPSGAYNNLGIGIADSATVSYITVVPKLTKLSGIAAFPNPTSSNVILSVKAPGSFEAHISVVGMDGAVRSSLNHFVKAGSNKIDIDLSNLSPGMYFIRIAGSNTRPETVKVIKQ